MSVLYKDCFEKGFSASISNIEGYETSASLNNVYEQDVCLLVKSKLSALNEMSFEEENIHESNISYAPKIIFKQSVILPEISNFSLE